MRFVAHTSALIFDLRDNTGGDPDMIALIATYLFDRPTHLNDVYSRLPWPRKGPVWSPVPTPHLLQLYADSSRAGRKDSPIFRT